MLSGTSAMTSSAGSRKAFLGVVILVALGCVVATISTKGSAATAPDSKTGKMSRQNAVMSSSSSLKLSGAPTYGMMEVKSAVAGIGAVPGGNQFLQLGNFRIGTPDASHLVLEIASGAPGSTESLSITKYRNDGFNGEYIGAPGGGVIFHRSLGTITGVSATGNGIEFGDFCLGMADKNHLSVSHKNHGNAMTAVTWTRDGSRHRGPSSEFSCWTSQYTNVVTSGTIGGRVYIQFGQEFRISVIDDGHLSVIGAFRACAVYSGTAVLSGPRDDYTC